MILIDKDALVAEIERLKDKEIGIGLNAYEMGEENGKAEMCNKFLSFLETLEVKEVDVSNISENLAEAYQYLGYTHTGNLAHNKPMVSARLKKAIQGLFDARLFKLTHDEKYRMERLGLKAQKGE